MLNLRREFEIFAVDQDVWWEMDKFGASLYLYLSVFISVFVFSCICICIWRGLRFLQLTRMFGGKWAKLVQVCI